MNTKRILVIFVVLMAIVMSGCATKKGVTAEINAAVNPVSTKVSEMGTSMADIANQLTDLQKSVDKVGNAPTVDEIADKVMLQIEANTEAKAISEQVIESNLPVVEKSTIDQPSDGGVVVTENQNSQTTGQWDISYYTGATQLMKDFVFTDYVPGWIEFPNVDWSAGNFLAKNGLEYGQELSDFCQQDQICDFPVAARSYRTITADYNIEGIGSCSESDTGIGCAVIIVNMGDVTASFRDQTVDTGHTITGLYWNGDEADQAISAWASHVVYRMVGVPGNNPANPGANCSVPGGCKGVNIRFAIVSGNELLVLGESVVNPTN